MQALAASKPKYAWALLSQIHIIDTKAADLVLQEAYLAYALVNPRGLPHIFYEIDLLLEYQNVEFKRFCTDRSLSLQESDEMFWLHAFLVNTFQKVKTSINKIIPSRNQTERHLTKDAFFDILSLANQLYRSKPCHPDGLERGKVYFSENQAFDLLK